MSLKKILDEINILASDNWLKTYCGPAEHSGIQILNKKKWFDATSNKYKDFLEKLLETGNKVIETINSKVKDSQNSGESNSNLLPMTVSFLVEDLARKESVKKAAGVCKWYESKSLPGIAYCIADARNILAASFDELFELFNAHNGVFLIKNNKIYRLHIDDEHFYSLLI